MNRQNRPNRHDRLNHIGRSGFASGNTRLIAVGWVLLLGALFWFFLDWGERESHPNRNLKVTGSSEIVLARSRDGHYYADGEINGRPVKFMLDTGATQIASTQKGVGRALARKIMREGVTAKNRTDELRSIGVKVNSFELNEAMLMGCAVVVETPQIGRAHV